MILAVAVLSLLVVYFDEATINDKLFGVSSLSRLSLLVSMRLVSFLFSDISLVDQSKSPTNQTVSFENLTI